MASSTGVRSGRRGGPGNLALALALLALAQPGCSWLVTARPPPLPVADPARPVDCDTNPVPALVDVVCGVYGATAAASGLGGLVATEDSLADVLLVSALLGGGAAALACGLSARDGFDRIAECRELKRLQTRCAEGEQAACWTLSPRLGPAPP